MDRLARWLRWLDREITQLPVGTRQLVVKRLHGAIAIAAIVVALIVGLAAGFFAGYSYPYKTLPPPPVPPGQTVPDCNAESPQQHKLGSCLPQPTTPAPGPAAPTSTTQKVSLERVVAVTQSATGPDLSNNDPVQSLGAWAAIAARNSFGIFKVVEGDSFADSFAAVQAGAAKVFHLVVGGYDFLRVCGPDPRSEGNWFVDHLIQDGLDPRGPNMLPPTGDAEFGAHGVDDVNCNARAWLLAWLDQVRSRVHRQPMIYTGAWWWDPHMGCFWPQGSLAWISGYTSSINSVPRPCGQGHIDLWQFTDAGWNGASNADLSIWVDGAPAFQAYSNGIPPDPYGLYPKIVFHLALGQKGSEYNTVKLWDAAGCENPVRREVCKSTLWHLKLERDRDIWVAAHHRDSHGTWHLLPKPAYHDGLGRRVQGLQQRITRPTGRRCTVALCG